LDENETKGYIDRRLQIAGRNGHPSTLFSAATIAALYRHSRGFPRLINTICENALITCYAKQMQGVTPEIIENVAKELRLDVIHTPETERINGHSEMDIQRATSALLDLYAGNEAVQVSEK
jgi:general secretion pathway protein A